MGYSNFTVKRRWVCLCSEHDIGGWSCSRKRLSVADYETFVKRNASTWAPSPYFLMIGQRMIRRTGSARFHPVGSATLQCV